MFYYLNNYFLFAILGYFFETTLFTLLKLHNESGFLHLFWTPVYGVGVLTAILIFNIVSKWKINKHLKKVILFISFFVVLSLLEYIGGVAMELLFGYPLWSYKIIPLHVGKYISIGTSILWAIFSLIYLYKVKDYTDKLIKKIPKFITIAILIIYILDNVITIYQVLHFRGFI